MHSKNYHFCRLLVIVEKVRTPKNCTTNQVLIKVPKVVKPSMSESLKLWVQV